MLDTRIAIQDRLDLELTDELLAANRRGLQEHRHQPQRYFQKTWSYDPANVWSGACERIGDALRSQEGILFIGPYECCGAIKVVPQRTLRVTASLLNFDGDTIAVGTIDASSGLYVDKFEEQSKWFVELVAWGEWASLVAPAIAP